MSTGLPTLQLVLLSLGLVGENTSVNMMEAPERVCRKNQGRNRSEFQRDSSQRLFYEVSVAKMRRRRFN